MEESDNIRELFTKYLENRISEAELGQLIAYFEVEDNRETLTSLIKEEMSRQPETLSDEHLGQYHR